MSSEHKPQRRTRTEVGLDAGPERHRWTFLLPKKPNPGLHHKPTRPPPSLVATSPPTPILDADASTGTLLLRRRYVGESPVPSFPRLGSRIPHGFAPCASQIFEYNGSAVVAMVGKNCFAIASDRRLGVQLQTIATDFQRVFKIHDKLYIGLSGLATDAQTL